MSDVNSDPPSIVDYIPGFPAKLPFLSSVWKWLVNTDEALTTTLTPTQRILTASTRNVDVDTSTLQVEGSDALQYLEFVQRLVDSAEARLETIEVLSKVVFS